MAHVTHSVSLNLRQQELRSPAMGTESQGKQTFMMASRFSSPVKMNLTQVSPQAWGHFECDVGLVS